MGSYVVISIQSLCMFSFFCSAWFKMQDTIGTMSYFPIREGYKKLLESIALDDPDRAATAIKIGQSHHNPEHS